MIALEDIEKKVTEHFLKHSFTNPPKYVLLDKKSFKSLCNSLKPAQAVDSIKVSKANVGGAELDILEVNTDKGLFEVVG